MQFWFQQLVRYMNFFRIILICILEYNIDNEFWSRYISSFDFASQFSHNNYSLVLDKHYLFATNRFCLVNSLSPIKISGIG